jgi:hypothetical protein
MMTDGSDSQRRRSPVARPPVQPTAGREELIPLRRRWLGLALVHAVVVLAVSSVALAIASSSDAGRETSANSMVRGGAP